MSKPDERLDLSGSGRNTRIEYLYRDADNWKSVRIAVLPGRITPAQAAQMLKHLDGGEYFVPGQVDLPDLQDSFVEPSRWNPDRDHIWHELTEIEYTDALPTTGTPIADFVKRFLGTTWDSTYKPPFYEEMKARYEAALAEETEDEDEE